MPFKDEIPLRSICQVACVSSLDELPAPLRRCFTHEIAASAPDAPQRAQLLAGFLGASARRLPQQELEEVAAQTAGQSASALRFQHMELLELLWDFSEFHPYRFIQVRPKIKVWDH
jgi:hypothetical protein